MLLGFLLSQQALEDIFLSKENNSLEGIVKLAPKMIISFLSPIQPKYLSNKMLSKYRHDHVGGGGGISNGKRTGSKILGNKIPQQIEHKKKNKRKGKEGTNIY